jgi:hypothetical protein
MKKPIPLLLIAATAVLAACMTPPPRSGEYMSTHQEIFQEESDRMQTLRDAGNEFSLFVTVPAADNLLHPFTNGAAIVALKIGGGSGPAEELLDILRKESAQAVAVVGKSDALTAATIEAAIQELKGSPTSTTILFAGKSKDVEKLQALADKAGVPFVGVAFIPQDKPEPDQTGSEPDEIGSEPDQTQPN